MSMWLLMSCTTKELSPTEALLKDVIKQQVSKDLFMTRTAAPLPPMHPDSIANEFDAETIVILGDSVVPYSEEEYSKELEAYEQFDWEQYRKDSIAYRKELANPTYDLDQLVLCNDSVYHFMKVYPSFDSRDYGLDPEGFQFNMKVDSTWLPLFKSFLSDRSASEYVDFSTMELPFMTGVKSLSDPVENVNVAAMLVFSKPAFSRDGKRAFIYYSIMTGPLSASGDILALEKTEDGWKIVGGRTLWIS